MGNNEDPKVQKRIEMEKRVTRVMMGYISKLIYQINHLKTHTY